MEISESDNLRDNEKMWETIRKIATPLIKKHPILVVPVIGIILMLGLLYKLFFSSDKAVNINSPHFFAYNLFFEAPTSFPLPQQIQPEGQTKKAETTNTSDSSHRYSSDRSQEKSIEPSARDISGVIQLKNAAGTWQRETDFKFRTWHEAQEYCDNLNLAGFTDWRLPSMKELLSLTADPQAPEMKAISEKDAPYFWSSVAYKDPTDANLINFKDGSSLHVSKEKRYGYVRCVRGG